MRFLRFEYQDEVLAGYLEGEVIRSLNGEVASRDYALGEVRLLAPCIPSKVVAIGLNYRDHAEEMGVALPEEPLMFLKPSTSIIGPQDRIVIPQQSERVDFEAELAIVIGKTARNVPRAHANDYILGYTCLNDVTARDLQSKDGQWTRAKGFDTFCPLGPWIETEVDPSDLLIELFLNGESKQRSRTSNLIFSPVALVEFVSAVMTLLPGDVIATGTTSGIGPMQPGDTVEVRIQGVGSLINAVSGPEE